MIFTLSIFRMYEKHKTKSGELSGERKWSLGRWKFNSNHLYFIHDCLYTLFPHLLILLNGFIYILLVIKRTCVEYVQWYHKARKQVHNPTVGEGWAGKEEDNVLRFEADTQSETVYIDPSLNTWGRPSQARK